MPSASVLNTTAGASGKTLAIIESVANVTGLWTFDRDPNPPFAVSGGSAAVANLDADKLDGVEAAAFLLKAGGTMTGALQGAAGTVSAVGVGVGDSDVGLYSSGTNALDVATAGVKALGIDSTQFIDSPTQPRCVAYNNAAQTVTAGNTTVLTLNAEDLDVTTLHDTVTNNSRVTIPTGGDGLYLVIGKAQMQAAASNAANIGRLHLRKNGTTTVKSDGHQIIVNNDVQDGTVVELLALVATDYVELLGQAVQSDIAFGSSTRGLSTTLSVVKLW